MNLNIAQVCGRMTKEPEMRTTPNGANVLNFSVATNYTYKNQAGEKVQEAEFHNVVAFGKTAEIIQKWFHKGDEIYIQGRLKTSKWEAKDKTTKYRTDIIAEKFEFGQKAKANQEQKVEEAFDGEAEEIQVENIPF